jgi:hypothetical protein
MDDVDLLNVDYILLQEIKSKPIDEDDLIITVK